MLVEYAGLNPFGGLRSDSIPRAGCPVVVLIFTLLHYFLVKFNFILTIVNEFLTYLTMSFFFGYRIFDRL